MDYLVYCDNLTYYKNNKIVFTVFTENNNDFLYKAGSRMKIIVGKFREEKVIIKVWILVVLMFCGLLLYFQVGEKNQIFNTRESAENIIIKEVERRGETNAETPSGIINTYELEIDDLAGGENCLAFFVRHQYVKVFIEGELIYSLSAPEGKKVGKTVGSEWVIVPLFPNDKGKQIKVEIIPIYEEIKAWEPEFKFGTHYNIFREIIRDELVIFTISALCVLAGIILIIMQLSYYYRHKANERNLIYLGVFSIMIGMFKLADLRMATIIFNVNPKLLFYIAIGVIPLAGVPMIYYMKGFIKGRKSQLLDFVCWLNVIFAAISILLQIFNVVDLRDNLVFINMLSLLVLITLAYELIRNGLRHRLELKGFAFWGLPLLIIAGGIWDWFNYVQHRSTDSVYHIIVAFFVYVMIMWIRSLSERRRKAYTDFQTGLFNKSRCNEMLEEAGVPETPTGIFMIDLNFLKQTNDKYGHEAGDLYISDFARILCESIPAGNFIGRFGGDEFIAVIYMTDESKMNDILNRIQKKVKEENDLGRDPIISYSIGSAISTHYHGKNLMELLEIADQRMYEEKKAHHKKYGITR